MAGVHPTNYPGQVKAFTDKFDDVDYVLADHVNALQDELAAVQNYIGIESEFPRGPKPNNPGDPHTTVAEHMWQVIPVGSVVPYFGSVEPNGWLFCNGQTFPANTWPKLEAVLGGRQVPDLDDVFILATNGTRIAPNTLDKSGATIKEGNLPPHRHNLHTAPDHTHTGPNHSHRLSIIGEWPQSMTSVVTDVQLKKTVPSINLARKDGSWYDIQLLEQRFNLIETKSPPNDWLIKHPQVGAGTMPQGHPNAGRFHTDTATGTTGGAGGHTHAMDDFGHARSAVYRPAYFAMRHIIRAG